MEIKNKNKIPSAFPIFSEKMDDKQVIYLCGWPKVISVGFDFMDSVTKSFEKCDGVVR